MTLQEDVIDYYKSQYEGLASKEYLYIKCKVNSEFAEKLLRQMYVKEKPFEGFEIMGISWEDQLINKETIDQILFLLGRKK